MTVNPRCNNFSKHCANNKSRSRHELTPPQEIARQLGGPTSGGVFSTVLMFTDQPTSTMFDTADGPHPTRTAELLERSDGPLTLATEAGRNLTLRLEYAPALYSTAAADRVLALTKHLLAQLADACRNDRLHDPVSSLKLLDAQAFEQAIVASVGAAQSHDVPTIIAAVAAQAEERPLATAVVEHDRSVTYGELLRRADAAAAGLRSRGVRSGDRVCLCVDRSIDGAAAILGIWQLGAIYVPLDPKYPPGRRRWILSDSVPALLVVGRQLLQSEEFDAASTIMIEELFVDAAPTVASNRPQFAATDPAVILYTSGSTGTPKGVVLTHGNLAAQNAAVRRAMDYSADDRTTTLSSPCFDAALEEVFAPLCCGATLVLPQADVLESLERLLDLATTERLTVLDMPTSLWRELTNYLADVGRRFPTTVRAVMTGGERATAATFQRFLRAGGDGIRWFNAYGPTEATICATLYEHDPRKADALPPDIAPPIGPPIDGAVIALVDAHGRLVPPEVPGEVVIGGAGVGLGYWRREDLTAQRFVERPHPALPAGRYYRTGDLARRNAAGVLEYLGRADGQVKLRGFRIEPSEIEAVVARHPSVRDVVVVVRTSPAGTEILVAYVVPKADAVVDTDALQAFVAAELPEYMVPRRFVTIDAVPLTPNGKTDQARLPDHFAVDQRCASESQREPSEIERRILDIWQTTLPGEAIRLTDDFFDRGGDSLKAMTLAARLEKELATKLPPHVLYKARTPEALARVVKSHDVQAELAPLVVLREGDRTRPIFLIHSLGGDAWIYRHVVEDLPGDDAVLGLQIPGLDGCGTPADTIEASAAEFLTYVRRATARALSISGLFLRRVDRV
ncbi:MAG: amino acid adenylation domain-containing protein [Pirellulales bacterium]